MNEQPSCWHCGSPVEASVFCAYCNRLQPPTLDYFRFFGLEPRLALDGEDLQRRFYELSRKLHPDRYGQGTPTERQYSLEATAMLNDAYRALRDPVARAEYVLRLEGLSQADPGGRTPPELLEEVFEIHSALEKFRENPQDRRPALEQARVRLTAMRQAADRELAGLFPLWDETQERGVLEQVRGVLERRRFLLKLESQLEEELSHVSAPPD